jgi:hypothetical protein
MALGKSNQQRHYPTDWYTYSALLDNGIGAKQIGFALDGAEVSRFTARYRVAKAFRGIRLDGYSPDTIQGYDSLMRVFLAWSAFEKFLQVVGKTQNSIVPSLAPYRPDDCLGDLRKDQIAKTFYDFVTPRVNEKHQSRLQEFANGTLTNPTYLASAVRHLFAHGHLTAHAGGMLTEHVDRVCEILFEFHLKVMDGEFSRIVRTFRDANL